MLTVEEKIKHLRTLGLPGDLTEIEKMYKGFEFDVDDTEYNELLKLSAQYCSKFTNLSGLISKANSKEDIDRYAKEKNKILDALFPGHGLIIGGGDGLSAVIGTVDLDGYNYINARVHFNSSSLIHLKDYVFVASNVEFGSNNIQVHNGKAKLGKIDVDSDTWIGADVSFDDNTQIGARSVIGMGSHIINGTSLASDMISFGNPCNEYKKITDDYETKIKVPEDSAKRTTDEVKHIIAHLQKLQIKGDFSQYIRALNYKKYNTIEPTISKIYELSHKLCSEYNCGNVSIRRRKEILDALFPLQGNNLIMGDDVFADCIGTVKIGNNVTIGNHPTLAGNIVINDGVKIGNNVTLQTTGHEVNYKGRKITSDNHGELCEISTPGYIIIEPCLVLADGTKVIPDQVVRKNTYPGQVVSRSSDNDIER